MVKYILFYLQNIKNVAVIFLIGLALIVSQQSLASPFQQTFKFDHFTVAQGLSQNSTYSITQDKENFIWIATQDGLNRFDGENFIQYRKNNADPNSIADNFIRKVFVDKDNTLWAGGFDGDVYKYNGLSWEMWNIATSATSNVIVSTITSDSEGNIYAGSRINAAMFDGTTWTTWTMENSGLSYRQVQDIEVYNNKVWLATTHGVSALQLTTMNTTPIISQNESINVYPNPILDNAIVRFTTVEKTAQIQVNVVSLDGRTIQEMIIAGNRPKGEQQLDIQKGNLSKGMYYLQIRYNNKQLTKAILIN